MIIAYLGRNVKEYRKYFLRKLEKLTVICPECSSRTVLHDRYNRHVHVVEKVEWIVIQRVMCCNCGKTHAIIPDFKRPYKHYGAEEIEFTLRDIEDGIPVEQVESPASTSAIKRWTHEFQVRGKQVSGALRALLKQIFDKTINEVSLTGLKIFKALEYILENFPEIESSNLALSDANMWLTHYMAGVYV